MKTIRLLVAAAVLMVYIGMCPAAYSQFDYWIHTNGPGTGYDVRSLAVNSAGVVYAGTWTDGSIWRTTDNGVSWSRCGSYPGQNPVLGMTTNSGDTVFASVFERGVLRSTDHGASWAYKSNGLSNLKVRGILQDKNGFLWVASEAGLFRSGADGETWVLKRAGFFGWPQQDSTGAMAVTDVSTSALHRSTDGGNSWSTIPQPSGQQLMGVHPDGSYFSMKQGPKILRSTDLGATWVDLNVPVNWNLYTAALTFNYRGDIFCAADGDAAGILISTDMGISWEVTNSGLTTTRTIPILHHPNGHLFVGTNGAGVFRTRVVPGPPSPVRIEAQPQLLFFRNVISGTSDTLSVHIVNSGYRDSLRLQSVVSTNIHFHAIIQTEVIPPHGFASMTVIYSPEIAGRDTGAILVTSNDPATPLFRLPVSGEAFAITNEPTIAELASPDYNQVRIVWFRSILDSSSSPDPVTEYSIWRRIPGSQASGGAGMTLSTSTGWLFEFVLTVPAMTFERYAARVPKVWDSPWSVYIVAAHTIGGHVYRSSPDSILLFTPSGTGASLEIPVPNESVLSQNYPNPFNPSTTIRYGLPRRSEVRLAVFSALGQQVALLVQGEQEAGYHEVMFNGSGLSSGVYFYRLQAGDYIATKRLLLLR